jgi:hypothetical protein
MEVFGTHSRLVSFSEPSQVETVWTRLVRVVRLATVVPWSCEVECEGQERPAQQHRRTRVAKTHHPRHITRSAESGQRRRVPGNPGSAVAFPEWRPLLLSDRLLGLPAGGSAKFELLVGD